MNLRTIEKKLSKGKRRCSQRISYYYKIKSDESSNIGDRQKPIKTLSRGDYYRKFREERKVLNILSNIVPNLNGERKERRTLRYVYYRILPALYSRFKYHSRDIEILLDLESLYYDSLNIMNYNRGTPLRINRSWWVSLVLDTAERDSLFQAKLY